MLLQDGTWAVRPGSVTVGDSVRIAATFPVVPGTSVRVSRIEASGDAVILIDPEVSLGDRTARVSYTVAVFAPGRQPVPTPTVEMITPSGTVREVPAGVVVVDVASVLSGSPDTLEPRPGFAPIPREVRRLEPLVFLELAVVFLAFVWWRLRSSPPLPLSHRDDDPMGATAPLATWAATGEVRAVAEVARRRLQAFLGTRSPEITSSATTGEMLAALAAAGDDLPYREIRELLTGLDTAAFAPTHGSEVAHLASQVDDLIADLSQGESAGRDREGAA